MSKTLPRFPSKIRTELACIPKEALTVDAGRRHWKVRIDGRLAFIYPFSSSPENERGFRNIIADLRRSATAAGYR